MNEQEKMPTTADREALAGSMEERTASYRLFSRLFLRPLTAEDVEALAAEELECKALALEGSDELAAGFNDMGRGLHRRHTGTQKLLATDFTMTFDGVAALRDERAVPYASVFIGAKTGDRAELFQAPRKADKAAYGREGIAVDASLGLPDDHLSFELSFMADMADKTAAALREGDDAEVLRLLEVADEFRSKHILSWYGLFRDLALQLVKTRFYRGVLRAAGGYLELDGDLTAEVRAALESIAAEGSSACGTAASANTGPIVAD